MNGTTTIPDSDCPTCGYAINRATVCEHGRVVRPKPGDFSVCIRCAAPLRFDDTLRMRLATLDEVDALDEETRGLLKMVQRRVLVQQAREAQNSLRRS